MTYLQGYVFYNRRSLYTVKHANKVGFHTIAGDRSSCLTYRSQGRYLVNELRHAPSSIPSGPGVEFPRNYGMASNHMESSLKGKKL